MGPSAIPGGYAAPGMAKRLVARIIDGVLIGVVLVVLGGILLGGAASRMQMDAQGNVTAVSGGFVAAYLGYMGLALVLGLLYEVGLIALRGATLGKQLMKIKVVREVDGAVPGWGPSVLRWILPQGASALTCGIGGIVVYLSPLFDNSGRQQGWHDKVAKTQVVSA